jgi:predicted DNA-binding transcriptional regulator YafY
MKESERKYVVRAQWARLNLIARWAREGARFTSTHIAARMEISKKTAQRDLTILRDDLEWPLEYDQGRGTWKLVGAPPEGFL